MSTPPPPPPPPPAPRPTYAPPQDARWARRNAREQRRTASIAARQQRALLRDQLHATRRSSLLGPVLLVILGFLLLSVELGHLAWEFVLGWLATWWPLVLVGAGVLLLAEWVYDTQTAGRQGTPLQRRTLGMSGVLVLVLLLVAGPVAAGVLHSSEWARTRWELPESWGLDQFFAQHSETVHQLAAPLSRGGLLTVQGYRGNITVTGSSQDGQVHVTATQRLWAWQSKDLKAREERERPSLEGEGSGLILRADGDGRDQTDLVIEVPQEAALQIAAERGDLAVSDLHGGLSVADHSGNITLTGLTGDVHLAVRDDDADITGHSLTGNVSVEGRAGDLSFSDLTGPLLLHGDFFGTTHLEHLQGALHFQSSFTKFTCAGVPGEVNVEGRTELQARDLVGPVELSTSDRDITLSDVRNGATVVNRKGSVTLSLVDLLSPVSVTTTDGTIEVHLPEKAPFHLEAETADGQIENDFGLSSQSQGDRVSLTGQILKGGPAIHLRTTEGDVRIRKGNAASDVEKNDDDDGKSDTDTNTRHS